MTSLLDLIQMKAKYISRSGSPGHYTYKYTEPKKDSGSKKQDNEKPGIMSPITKQDRKEVINGHQVAAIKMYVQGKVNPLNEKEQRAAHKKTGVKVENWDLMSPASRIKLMEAHDPSMKQAIKKIRG